jgi:branched-chain amino acid aminotransferase
VGIPFQYETEELIQIAYQLLQKNDYSDAYIRPLVYCGPNMQLTQTSEVYLMMCAWQWEKYHGDKQLKLCVSSYQRPNPNSLKMEAKVTGHYVNSILATSEAKVRGYDEALMLDMNGNVAEAPGANFFMEKNGALITPALGHILPGITRQTVMNICRELDIPVTERTITPDELESADSAFLCGTAAEVVGIESIDAKPFAKPWFESLGASVQEAYRCQVLEKSFSYVII